MYNPFDEIDILDIRGAVHEGIFYLWNPDLLDDVLGAELGEWAAEVFHVTRGGTFEDGLSTLQLRGRPDFAKLDEVARLVDAGQIRTTLTEVLRPIDAATLKAAHARIESGTASSTPFCWMPVSTIFEVYSGSARSQKAWTNSRTRFRRRSRRCMSSFRGGRRCVAPTFECSLRANR